MASQRHKCEVHGEESGLPSIPCPAYENVSPIVPNQAPQWVSPLVVPVLSQNVAITPLDMDNFVNGADTYAVTTGTLPTGLTLASNTGVLSGTPTVIGDTMGLVITATNANGGAESDPFTISVVA